MIAQTKRAATTPWGCRDAFFARRIWLNRAFAEVVEVAGICRHVVSVMTRQDRNVRARSRAGATCPVGHPRNRTRRHLRLPHESSRRLYARPVGELSGLDARADVVGSLPRPGYLLEARERGARGEISPAELKTASVDNEGVKLEMVAKSAKTLWS
jgi:hypothetical protein